MKLRQDGWTSQEDRWLADAVLDHIRKGSTQLKAFDEIAEKVNRTSAACGFRWNSCIRKEFQQQIFDAKKERYAMRKQQAMAKKMIPNSPLEWSATEVSRQLEKWIVRLSAQEETLDLEKECERLKEELKNEQLERERLQLKIEQLDEDYRALLFLIEKARKLGAPEESPAPAIFQMESNGNLHKKDRLYTAIESSALPQA